MGKNTEPGSLMKHLLACTLNVLNDGSRLQTQVGTRFWQAKETDGSGEVGKLVRIIILKRKQGDQKKPISII